MLRQIIFLIVLLFSLQLSITGEKKKEAWPGVDEAVVEKYAAEYGRPARDPIIKIEGDLLLFAFALGGTIGGFIMGYNWRRLFSEKDKSF